LCDTTKQVRRKDVERVAKMNAKKPANEERVNYRSSVSRAQLVLNDITGAHVTAGCRMDLAAELDAQVRERELRRDDSYRRISSRPMS